MSTARALAALWGRRGLRGAARNGSAKDFFSMGAAARTGLFGLKAFARPGGFQSSAKQAMENIKLIKSTLLSPSGRNLSPKAVLHMLDCISNELCCVIDAAEACRNLHTNPKFLESSQTAFEQISVFISELNNDPQLYRLLASITKDDAAMATLSAEERAFALDIQRDFEVDGIHLSAECQARLRDIQAQMVGWETTFAQNNMKLSERGQRIVLGPFTPGAHFNQLRSWLDQYESQNDADQDRGLLRTSLDRRLVHPLLKSLAEEPMRKHLWACSVLTPTDNVDALTRLIQQRHHLAQELGFPSYSHRALLKNILQSPEQVQDVLHAVSEGSRARTQQDLAQLAKIKPLSSLPGSGVGNPGEVQPWDLAFLGAQFQRQHTDSSVSSRATLRKYLSLPQCLGSLTDLAAIFGLHVLRVRAPDSEGWLSADEEVVKLEVRRGTERGELLGTVFLDLFARQGKFPGAAHFIVQCGCDALQLPGSAAATTTPATASAASFSAAELGNAVWSASRQAAVVVLTFSMDPGSAEAGLRLDELETLYHEWGHSLHSLCSLTKFQHLSGTRGGTDFIEIPSHVMEHFARDHRWLGRFARHQDTLQPPSAELVAQALRDDLQLGIRTQTQLLYAAADQALFGRGGASLRNVAPEDLVSRTLDLVCAAQRDFTVLPVAELHGQRDAELVEQMGVWLSPQVAARVRQLPLMSIFAHTHFINYGGSYYSYLLAKAYAAQIWQRVFMTNPLDHRAGEEFRDHFLAHGALGKDSLVLDRIAGGPLDVTHYLRALERR